jgi:decaprenylphospho-beta-D-ribofuranose 2-oxidase
VAALEIQSAVATAPRTAEEVATTLTAWGRLPAKGREQLTEDLERSTIGAALCRGLGRSYGDSSLPARAGDKVVSTRLANRILSFDEESGDVVGEAGVSLAELNRLLLPRGWFTPVTPGTKFVTLGGMVASDVHGKNHHREGCFGAHVQSLRMRLADESVVECSANEHADLFYGTIRGMGLLGHILRVEFRMRRIPSPWIRAETERVRSVNEFLAALGRTAPAWPMTMGWIDCLSQGSSMGRGILTAGRWATAEEAPAQPPLAPKEHTFPLELPNWALNSVTASMFNAAYYWRHMAQRWSGLMTPDAFFYPLDAILHWNRAYGPRGFTQYQCVLPRAAGGHAVREFMYLLTKLGGASPLCVIKDCGPEGKGVLSFPLEGTSIAVDMAVSPELQRIVDHLNAFVIEAGGRVYLTKDRFTRPEHFRAMEPRLSTFFALRDKWDPKRRLRSAQSVRLFGDLA